MNTQVAVHRGIRFAVLVALLFASYIPIKSNTTAPAAQTQEALLGPLDHLGGEATAVGLLEDSYAVAMVGRDLVVLDVIDPSRPVQVARLSFSNPITDLYTFGRFAYLLTVGYLHIIDITNPYRPADRGTSLGYAYDIAGEGDLLFLARGDVSVYSLSNPASPELVVSFTDDNIGGCGEFYAPYYSVKVVSSFPFVYAHARHPCWDGVFETATDDYIVNISDIANPIQTSNLKFTVNEAAPAGDYVYFATGQYYGDPIRVVARTDMDTLEVAATVSSPGGVKDIAVQGSALYVLDDTAGLRILDINDPLAPTEVGVEAALAGSDEIVVPGRLAYVAGGSLGLIVLDVTDPGSPGRVGKYHTVGIAKDVTISGSYAYVSSDKLLDIVDISDPYQLRAVAEYPRTGDILIAGEVLYLAAGADGLAAVDISNPAAPAELDVLDTPGEASGVALSGDYAYVADGGEGLRVVDVSDPGNLREAGSLSLPDRVVDVAVSGGYAYLVGDTFSVVDVSDPTAPTLDFTYTEFTEFKNHVAVYGDQVYVTWSTDYCGISGHAFVCDGGLLVFEKNASSDWEIILDQHFDCPVGGLEIVGEQIYVTSSWAESCSLGIFVYDASNPTNPDPIYSFQEYAWGLAVSDDLVIVADQEEGLYSLKWWTPRSVYFPMVDK